MKTLMAAKPGNWLVLALSVLALVLSLSRGTTAEEAEDPTGYMKLIHDTSKDLFIATADALKEAEHAEWSTQHIERVRELLVLVKLVSGDAQIHFHE